MWDTIKMVLLSQGIWNAIINLLVGAIIGAIAGVWYSLSANKPKLIISGGGGSSETQADLTWKIDISNRPSFLGQALYGEAARELRAYVRLNEPKAQDYMVFWGLQHNERTTIEPGKQNFLELFHWKAGTEGYFIFDNNREPIAKFHGRELTFVLTMIDLLERRTKIRFLVEFDDTHLINKPQLRIIPPITMHERINRARDGLREFLSAFRARW